MKNCSSSSLSLFLSLSLSTQEIDSLVFTLLTELTLS